MRTKPFLAPVWFTLSIGIFLCIVNVLLFQFQIKAVAYSPKVIFFLFLWPTVILIESFIYWRISEKITDRKWVWAHIIFTLFAFVILRIIFAAVVVFYLAQLPVNSRRVVWLTNGIDFYLFWISFIIGHVFFIVVLTQSFTAKKNPPPDESFLDIPQ